MKKLKFKYLVLKRRLYLRYLLFVGKRKVKKALKKDGIWSGVACACVISGHIHAIASMPIMSPEGKGGLVVNVSGEKHGSQ